MQNDSDATHTFPRDVLAVSKFKIAALVLLWALMSTFGIALHERSKTVDHTGKEFVSVAGLDGDMYLRRYCNVGSLFRIRKRHPAEAIVSLPAVVVGSAVAEKAGEEPAKMALILLSAALAVGTVWLLWLVTADAGAVAVWLSFAYVWLLASAPEFFAVSQAVLLGTLLMVRRRVSDLRVWGGMALLAGGVTVTNAVKPVAALAVSLRRNDELVGALRRHLKKILLSGGIVCALFAVLELGKWHVIDEMSPVEEIAIGWDYIVKWFSGGFALGERLRRIWEMFFLEPIMTHGAIFGQANEKGLDLLPLGYRWPVPHVLGAVILALCTWSAWKNRGEAVVRAALAMVAFDFLLHVVLGWGLVEAQIYSGHWLYVIPVLLAGLGGRWWKYALAAAIAVWNLQYRGAVT